MAQIIILLHSIDQVSIVVSNGQSPKYKLLFYTMSYKYFYVVCNFGFLIFTDLYRFITDILITL